MDTETLKRSPRQGIAMFVVLGAIVLVTLFGYVGITLAGRDQTLSGDLNDIKSRDEAAVSALQFGINRLLANPTHLVTLLNAYATSGRLNGGTPTATWLSFGSVSTTFQGSEPGWTLLSTDATNKSAIKLQVLGIGSGDSTLPVTDMKDSAGVYISFRGLARGRHGDIKEVIGAYRIHGISIDYRQDTLYYTIPRHSFYIGGIYKSANMAIGTDGDVYVAGADGSFLNSGSGLTIKGDLKWNSTLKVNSSDVVVEGNAYIDGSFYTNGGALIVNGNLGIAQGFDEINGRGLVVGRNLWVGGTGIGGNWNNTTGGVYVGGNFVFEPSDKKTPHNLKVGGSAWFPRASSFSIEDTFSVGSHLFFGNNATNQNHTISSAAGNYFRIDSSLIFSGGGNLSIPFGTVAETLQVNTNLSITGGTLNVSRVAQVDSLQGGTLTGTRAARGTAMNWRIAPTLAQMGISDSLRSTSTADNPMDSVKVDALHSPTVLAAMQHLTTGLFQAAGVAAGESDKITAFNLNKLYTYMQGQNTLLNGYMVLRVDSLSGIGSNFAENADSGFKGKMLIAIEKKFDVNGNWPHSQGHDNIQVLMVRNGGALRNFGWKYGNFSGLFYWENPCENINMEIPTATMYGAILMGTTLTSPGYGYPTTCGTGAAQVTPNANPRLNIVRDQDVFLDIGKSLPGVLAPAKDGAGVPISIRGTTFALKRNGNTTFRLVHNQPYFEPIGVFR
jgi:Tfp pilus assembly protein PilX